MHDLTDPKWVSPPGDTILRLMRMRSLSQEALAELMGIEVGRVGRLLTGNEPITCDLADRLVRALGSTSLFWIRREQHYREGLLRVGASQTAEKE
jgi:HTH-type transcriptional regulator/antitoxin HigA